GSNRRDRCRRLPHRFLCGRLPFPRRSPPKYNFCAAIGPAWNVAVVSPPIARAVLQARRRGGLLSAFSGPCTEPCLPVWLHVAALADRVSTRCASARSSGCLVVPHLRLHEVLGRLAQWVPGPSRSLSRAAC